MGDGAVRVQLIGRMAVEGAPHGPVPSGRASRLLAMLAVRHGEFVPASTLADQLWPERPPDRPDRNVAALVSRLRRSLGRNAIDGGPRAYRLVRGPTTVDLTEATDLVAAAEREMATRPAVALDDAGRAVELLVTGTPLAGEPDDEWADQVRRRVETALRRARRCRWSGALAVGDPDVAIDEAGRALDADPLDEDACRALMRAHMQRGSTAAALGAFDTLREALSARLGVDPSAETRQVHLDVLRGDGVPPARSGGTAPRTPAPVGREDEFARLVDMWAGAGQGRRSIALLHGESGIGKSTLCEALCREAASTGAVTVTARCAEAERSLYLQPFAQCVREIVARHAPGAADRLSGAERRALAALVPELDPAADSPSGSELRHRRTVEALTAFLAHVARSRPLLLAVEDLEHAGETTLEVLHHLADRLTEVPVLLVVTENTSENRRRAVALDDVAVDVEVGPLSRDAVARLLREAGSQHDLDRFFTWTGGSPLLVSELLRHPAPSGGTGRDSGAPDIPDTLHDALARRLAGTAEDVRELLAQAAVFGRAFTVDDVAALARIPVEECAHRCERALRAGLVVAQEQSFRFANDILREIIHQDTPAPVRVSRHRRAARLFPDRPEIAARHHAEAGDHIDAARAWGDAAEAAHRAFAHTEAERMLSRAVEQADLGGDRAQAAQMRLRRGTVRCDLARHEDARDDHERALDLARALGDESLEARALEGLGWTALYARDAMAAVDLAERAGHLAESAAAAPGARRSSLLLLGRVRHWDGDYDGATRSYDEVLEVGPADTLAATATAYRGALLQHMDRFAEARAVLERAVVLCARTGEFRTLLQSLFFCALARGDVGDFSGALRSLGRARTLIDEAGVDYYRAGIETTTSWVWQELGEIGRAREHAGIAVGLARRGGGALELEQELHALLALADCDLLEGRDDDAGAGVEAAAPLLKVSLPFRPRAEMRLIEMQARWEPERAEELLAYARRFRSAKYEALALTHLGRDEEAATAAARTGSDLVVASVGASATRAAARDRICAGLPAELRTAFAARGRLGTPSPVLH
ncbi:ATP-binding protein [Pseudonocardia endophytica]|uniref:Transcriptional regulator n=1 Tax=Pseudonocardia endophytica TaxID=401976 RepID=A0A4R1I378_PSEEN|nr:AAA family ATPase [Pseudonocardia endophytica]TCK24422.1 transcriptional regulator [Pseudonocardia endophytica]